MSQASFDIDGLLSAAGRFDDAAAEAGEASGGLAAIGIDPTAFGGTGTAAALAGALADFHAGHSAAATSGAASLGAFAGRLRAVCGLGADLEAETRRAAGG